jgi:hypothetical protein
MTIPEHISLPIAVLVSVIAALAFWWWWPRWQVNRVTLEIRDPKARADIEDKFRKTVGQLLGGAALLFGAWLAFYNSLADRKKHDGKPSLLGCRPKPIGGAVGQPGARCSPTYLRA